MYLKNRSYNLLILLFWYGVIHFLFRVDIMEPSLRWQVVLVGKVSCISAPWTPYICSAGQNDLSWFPVFHQVDLDGLQRLLDTLYYFFRIVFLNLDFYYAFALLVLEVASPSVPVLWSGSWIAFQTLGSWRSGIQFTAWTQVIWIGILLPTPLLAVLLDVPPLASLQRLLKRLRWVYVILSCFHCFPECG